jgi:hypothetical protein
MFHVWRDVDGDGDDESLVLRTCKNCHKPYPLTAEYFKQLANGFQKTCKACPEERSTTRKDRKRVALEELHPNQACRLHTAGPAPITPAKETRPRTAGPAPIPLAKNTRPRTARPAPIPPAKETRPRTARPAPIAPAKETQYTLG